MSSQPDFKQIGDLDPALLDASGGFDLTKLAGHWKNTNTATNGIAECVIRPVGQQILIQIFGSGINGLTAWPPAQAQVLANLEEEAGQRSGALAASFEFGFMNVDVYIRVNRGVLVIVLYATFHDNSGRSNYVTREFFYRSET